MKMKLYKTLRTILGPVMRLLFPISVSGAENLPEEGAAILCANHTCLLDPVMLGIIYRRPVHFMAKEELFKNKILNAFFRTMGMNKSRLFRLVRLPYALPYFFSGLHISAVYSVMGAVIGEWLGAANGLGILLIRAQSSFDLELVFAAILAIIIWSSLIFALVRLAENKALSWQKYQREEKWDAAGF